MMKSLFTVRIAKSNSVLSCIICDGDILKGQKRILWRGNYLPIHYDCFVYHIITGFPEVREMKKSRIREIEKKLIAEVL